VVFVRSYRRFLFNPNISLPQFGRYNKKGEGVCFCHVITGEEMNSYKETFLLWWSGKKASFWPPVPDVAQGRSNQLLSAHGLSQGVWSHVFWTGWKGAEL